MTEDFYDLLEISSDASQDEIKDAYREQVRVYHPDHNDDDRARAQFTAVKKAYDILGDPVERKAYDRMGHKDYVAKRTSGIPSPDVWQSTDNSQSSDKTTSDDSQADETSSGKTFTYSSSSSSSAGDSTTSKRASATGAKTGGTTTTTSGTTSSTTTGSSGTSKTTAGTSSNTTTGGSGTSRTATGATTTTNTTHSGSSAGSATRDETQTTSESGAQTGSGGRADNPISRWWRRQNFSLPLIWLSVCLYVVGLAHFAFENEAGLEALSTELQAIGADPNGLWETLSSSRHGIETTTEFLVAVELVAPPLEPLQWYAALAGGVGATLLVLLGARLVRDRETWGPVSIDETIVVALAVAVSTTLVGGPLLAGAVLMPVLFGVIVRHTRRGPGWKPSYLYVLPVLAPAVGFAIAAAGAATLAIDLLAFVVLPIVGALGLPLRATIRKRFGR
ncbi:J domain-containing protein [Natronorubrum bangense]|uniref:Heat shock protein DnaJ domain protein n=2 Tax=Natronorubrum bangense TaxID=61858 RepID=L9W3R7_9EURY|nr:DnaJ domain-containing protein [Natronorubrum bangense]ELY43946.1 heat shock protein DnaJ domain protein [Natronorubrum bangense JCM 10635]QCC55730.1 molecular chaperone DnaJ [Natronorubrum bangense]